MRIGPATLLVTLAIAAPAEAAVVSYDGQVRFRGDAGANEVTILAIDGGVRLRVRDDATTLSIEPAGGSECVRVDEHEAVCPNRMPPEVRTEGGDDRLRMTGPRLAGASVDLGDGNDKAETDGGYVAGGAGDDDLRGPVIHGNAGNDRLVVVDGIGRSAGGEDGDDVITGTDLPESLSGGPGRDRIEAGAGDDTLADDDGAAAAPDVYDGGPGTDRITYRDDMTLTPRTAGVQVDLIAGTGGASGEGDVLAGLEGATGTSHDDVLRGTDGPDGLDGSFGSDVVDGRAGNDLLEDGPGFDHVFGGAGDDELRGGSDDDVLDGGPGDDVLSGWHGRDTLLGGDGADRLTGGEGPDLLEAGAGDDVLHAEGDFTRDAVRCGAGADTGVADTGDDVEEGCESLQRVGAPFPPFLKPPGQTARATAAVTGRVARFVVGCEFRGDGPRTGFIVLYIGGREAGRGAWDCRRSRDQFQSGGRSSVFGDVTLTRAAARRVRRSRKVRATAVIDLRLDGQLPVKERVLLVRGRS